MEKQWAFFIAGPDGNGDKVFFTGSNAGEKLLQFLKDNDPIECGAQQLLPETIKKLEALGPDDLLDEADIL